MKKIISTLVLVIGIIWQLQAQVSGFAYLNGQTDHSGIKVKFIAKSPSAKTDSTFTNVDGSYSKSLQAGAYLINFSKNGFDSINYDNGNYQLVNGTLTISDVNLLFKVNNLDGNIKGVLKANTKYKVINDIIVLPTDTLYIQKGCNLDLNNFGFYVYGYLKVLGENDSKCKFENGTIVFNNNINASFESSNFKQCILNGIEQSNLFINNCLFTDLYFTTIKGDYSVFQMTNSSVIGNTNNHLILNSDSVLIFNNTFSGATYWTCNITIKKYPSIFSCNKIIDGYGYTYIDSRIGNTVVESNVFQLTKKYQPNSGNTAYTGGIIASKCLIKNNIIENAGYGIYSDSSNIFNNNFLNCNEGIMVDLSDEMVSKVKNNIFYNVDNCLNGKVDASYNVFYQCLNISNISSSLYGIYFGKNINNDSVDVYYNLVLNPQFLNSNKVSYKSGSPIYGAGLNGTNIGFDPKGTCLENEWFLGSIDTLTLSGTVHQASSYLKNGKVVAYNIDKNTFKETITDANGNFTFDSLAIGNYVIKAIPNNGENYLTTFFPNKSDSLSAVKINLDADITSVDIFMNSITGIDNTIGGGVITKPNPFENQLFVKVLENTSTGIQASISNAVGDVITQLSIPANENEFSINTTELPSGFYFLKVETGTKVLVQKVLKQ